MAGNDHLRYRAGHWNVHFKSSQVGGKGLHSSFNQQAIEKRQMFVWYTNTQKILVYCGYPLHSIQGHIFVRCSYIWLYIVYKDKYLRGALIYKVKY